ncbi:hypothetical protein B5D80_27915 [Micromonospora wenchangensis]|uniref:Uncharacterized protein n=1 Tax=Micromonospora wenchangensis TaxID=1185415 RepID=A0A246REZ9_9ACTN|nr:hypothetical protein [Micromonospora wenchangensis]OWV00499.1 hypothetical protein B5D80_27915 [Micromonospora wenchangensis]
MKALVVFVVAVVLMACLMGFGALLFYWLMDEPTDRERALERQVEALKRANRMGAAYFDAQAQLREEMSRAANARRGPTGRATVGRASVSRRGVIDGDWR